ncbi:c-type cytochrome [Acidobacteria bacterium AH-259-O06]|nr:c-type cytochrome [Acidobacteria bacterium AH-259-O06]
MIWLVLLLVQNLTDPGTISRGKRIFVQTCSVGYCHGVGGAAGAGPRLRGRKLDKDYVYRVTRDGIPQSAMPAWKGRLRDEDIWAVVAYVLSLSSAVEPASAPAEMPPGVGPAAFLQFPGPAEAKRGHDLFFDATRGTRCATCHSLGERGIPIGPDLRDVASENPAQLLSLIRNNRSKHVLTARLESGEVFPALRAGQNEKWVKLYDLTTPPPVLRTLERSQITSIVEANDWQHAAVVRNYKTEELQAIIPYLKWERSQEK